VHTAQAGCTNNNLEHIPNSASAVWKCSGERSDEKMKLNEIAYRIRPAGWILLIGGCVALAWFFATVQQSTYTQWMWLSKNLPEMELIPREEAISALRQFQLRANGTFRRMILLPTAAMFVGGIILAIGKKKD